MTPVTAAVPQSGADSPIGASRTSSPCNSSRPGSPHQQQQQPISSHQPSPPQQPQPPPARLKFPPPRAPPPPSAVGPDHLRETIGKEMPKFMNSLQNYSNEQLSRMSDEDLRDIGLNQNAIIQLRSILNKQVITNGIGPSPQIIDMSSVKKKVDQQMEPEYGCMQTVVRRYPDGMTVYPHGIVGPPMSHCYSCYIQPRKCMPLPPYQVAAASLQPPPPPQPQPPHHHLSPVAPPTPTTVLTDSLRTLRLDTEPSSASDTASDHSPPETPAPISHLPGPSVSGEGPPGDERLGGNGGNEDRRAPHVRSRGIGRNRSNPPGIQKLPRGRGPNNLVQRRREMGSNMSNGGVDDRKVYNNGGNGSNGGSNNGNSGGNSGGNGGSEPPTPTATGYFTSYMAPYIRPTAYPSFHHHPGFVRHTYPAPAYHNGDIVYPYPPPQGNGPPPQGPPQFLPGPPQTPYSPAPPPPGAAPQLPTPPQQHKQLSCYNCGCQSHAAMDCLEATIEEITKQGKKIFYFPVIYFLLIYFLNYFPVYKVEGKY
ncbi:hypothetical protein O3M35_004753 [Rhynocoris fuscipes]|uniref:CCHC-type domain-containing protein n=1 Tax=Rhynocoris fuscipes TaxID=488301 RepID=A0AAW1DHF4_9HEMI